METIQIYHTNDVHSHLKRWPRIKHFISEKRLAHQKAEESFFLFDIGDFIDRWHPLSDGTKGRGNVELLNDCHYTAITIGNNEGVNFSFEDLNHLYDEAAFDVIVANLYKDANHPHWVSPFKIYHSNEGTRIGIIGVTAYFTLLYGLLGWKLTEPIAELKKWLPIVRKQADVIILLSHLGLTIDEQIAVECPEVDVILGGHTHHKLPEGKQVGGTLLAGAGKHGNFVGQVTISLDKEKKIKNKIARLYEVMKLPAVPNEKLQANELYQQGKKKLNQKIISLPQPFLHNLFEVTPLATILCGALREWCEADCAFINAGLLLGPLAAGNVTKFDLLKVCPHPINPCKIVLTGQELTRLLLETSQRDWENREVKGLGFRGTIMGTSVYDQIVFKEEQIFLKGTELDPEQNYSIAIPDMFTFGHFFTDILKHKEKEYFLPEFLRDVLSWKLQKQS
jgi:5'-nucleotidase